MKILVVGTGAREHAIVRALSLDPAVTELHAAPGNPGIGALATLHAVNPLDGPAVAVLAADLGVDLVVVGPEAPLVAGVADRVREAGIPVFGPSAEGARLEGSKAFAKEVMAAAGVPTAAPRVATDLEQAAAALDELGAPYVVKDDGLAAGKGVVVTDDRDEALAHAHACLEKQGGRIVIEEYLDGPEVSLFVLSDGTDVVPLVPAQDFKRAHDADEGPNTGGMGAYSPLPWAPEGLVDEVLDRVARPTIAEMARRGTPFAGVLYVGLALTSHGPQGRRVQRPLRRPRDAGRPGPARHPARGCPARVGHRWTRRTAPARVARRRGRDGRRRLRRATRPTRAPATRSSGVVQANALDDVHVLHAGTSQKDGVLLSAGGRVLSVVGVGADLAAARAAAYAGVDLISLQGAHHRSDIALAASQG